VKGVVRNEVKDMVERIHVGADEEKKSKRMKTAIQKFVDHFSLLIHQSADTLFQIKQIAYRTGKIQQCGSLTGLED
jgi:hypothetical protein